MFNKGLSKIICAISLFLLLVLPFFAEATVWVDGYSRKDGTWVDGYYRSEPNALEYDNYSWEPGDDLFNKSYYSSTRNYSSNWFTPSWIWDDEYQIGKRWHDTYGGGNGYSGSIFGDSTTYPTVSSYSDYWDNSWDYGWDSYNSSSDLFNTWDYDWEDNSYDYDFGIGSDSYGGYDWYNDYNYGYDSPLDSYDYGGYDSCDSYDYYDNYGGYGSIFDSGYGSGYSSYGGYGSYGGYSGYGSGY